MSVSRNLEIFGCRAFQAGMKLANYAIPYRLPEYRDGPGSIQKLPDFIKEKKIKWKDPQSLLELIDYMVENIK